MGTASPHKDNELGRWLAPFRSVSPRALVYGAGALALMLVYLVQGHPSFFTAHLAPRLVPGASPAEVALWATVYQWACAFVLFLVVPALLLKLAGKESLRALGLGLGDWRAGLWVAGAGLVLLALPGGLSAGWMPAFVEEYPLSKWAPADGGRFVLYELAYGLLYYVAWESFFRGFLQMGLRGHIGDVGAILVQTTASTLLHIGKPPGEIWAALLAGFLFGAAVLRTRSVWPLVIIHWGLGVITDLSCAHAGGIWP